VPADQRPPRGPVRPPPAIRRAGDPQAEQRRRVERIWALALRRFRDYLHGTDRDSSQGQPRSVDDNAAQNKAKSHHDHS
jgi:hypothetical protein